MKDTRKNTKDTKKRKNKKNNLKQSSFIEKIFAKKKKKQKHIHTERENSEKKEKHGKHTEIMKKDGKSRNKEEIFSGVNFNSKKMFKKKYTKK